MERKEALYYSELNDKYVKCELCGHNCKIPDTGLGVCKVRRNIDGKLYSLNYGKIIALMIDPIEKKPLYHFYPGSKTLSLAMQGCNFKCQFCQNSNISQIQDCEQISGDELLPDDIVKIAKAKNINIISYTYTEPTVFYEFMLETAMLAKNAGMKNVMVTNGFINDEPFKELLKVIDAFNVDLKSFRETTYENIIGGRLDLVLMSLEAIARSKSWLEITTLIIPGMNDTYEEKEDIANFISNMDKNIPWHISKFYPHYKMEGKGQETDFESLKEAYVIGVGTGLKYVYIGNVMDKNYTSTYCPTCKKEVIERIGYSVSVKQDNLDSLKGKCESCGANIDGKF
ncbi:MAG: AmmeMemoRadiSam system radical SAM enzyme [Proteobacteria bacterium]|nr:AmmeMemoRadiSam system radical SAM enzyme [Pseudomonadota bacterium]